jgi:hypothetical protein
VSGVDQLAGSLRVRPGAPVPDALHSGRQDWAGKIGRGQPASALPGLLSGLFSLCGHAHRLCAQLAINAAAPGTVATPADVAQRLRIETAQEHVRRIGLDWPRLLAGPSGVVGGDAAVAALRSCPLLKRAAPGDDPWPATLEWLQRECLQMPATTWLRAWQACGADWLLDWSLRHTGWLPTLLHTAREADTGPAMDMSRALRVHANPAALRTLAAALALKDGFAMRPQWHGGCAHTGPWARQNAPDDGLALTPWAMLGSRLAELVRLCLPGESGPGGARWLGHGSLQTGDRQGLAWVEMARGLLVHQVGITPSPDGPTVLTCRVLAPTEWNFHPQGEVARRVAALDRGESAPMLARQVGLLMAAFDPCVPFQVEAAQAEPREVQHA